MVKNLLLKQNNLRKSTGLNEGLALKSTQVITIFITIVLLIFLFWFLQKTKTGKSMRAFSDNEDLALLSGINQEKLFLLPG